MEKTTKREQIIKAAFKLFKKNGFYASGVDLIMREANVSKRTMYVYFPTKNALIVAVLEHYLVDYRNNLNNLLSQKNISSRDKILLIFNDAKTWFDDINFRGCLAVNAMGEFSGKEPSIEQACHSFKEWELGVFLDLTRDMGVKRPEDLAYQLLILLEGIRSLAHMMRQPCPIDIDQMVKTLLDSDQNPRNRLQTRQC